MDLTYEDVQNILKIIDDSSLEELELDIGDFKLIVRRRSGSASPGGAVHAGTAPDVQRVSPAATPLPVWPEGGSEPVMVRAAEKAKGAPERAGVRPPQQRGHEVKAPTVGTFYRAPAPGAAPFVEVGSLVAEDDTVCIIEIMKLMHSIKAGCRGRVAEICPENGALVEFGQTLMVIEPIP